MATHTLLQAHTAPRGGLIALAMLALACGASLAEHLPGGFYSTEPPAWQRAGIEAALRDPSSWVQACTLDQCTERKWIPHLHIQPAQWLLWLQSPQGGLQDAAARAAGLLGAQMPPEVQRALLRLQTQPGGNSDTAHSSLQALSQTGSGLIPDVQLAELACLLHPQGGDEMERLVCQALGRCGAALAPEVLQKLQGALQDAEAPLAVRCAAADVLASLGPHLPPQAREPLLRMLLDPQTDRSLRGRAAQAMGSLGAQMPPQALQLLHDVLRDRSVDSHLRCHAADALAQTGARMPPHVREALLAAYAEAPAGGADADTITDHKIFHQRVAEALGAPGQDMPPVVQMELLQRFTSTLWTPQPDYTALFALEKAGPQTDAAVLFSLFSALQGPHTGKEVRSSIGGFFQRLAEHGHLPLKMQGAVIMLAQEEAADLDARCQAALILGHLGEKATAQARQALYTLLRQDADPVLRIYGLQAMELLGPHMPPEAVPVLLTLLKRRAASTGGDLSDLVPAGGFEPSLDPLQHVVPALGSLGPQMPPEAPAALLAVLLNKEAPLTACALALAQAGDRLSPEIQQSLIARQRQIVSAPEPDYTLCSAISQTLSASGLHPVSDAQLAAALSLAHGQSIEPASQRSLLYFWLGRSPDALLAVRWLGHQDEDPPLDGAQPQEVLSLISRLWPHTALSGASPGPDAPLAALRLELARRTRQILTTHLKSGPLDEPLRKVLHSLSTQLGEDTAPDCAAALKHVQSALGQAMK